jgi:hypothetical protein
VRRHLLAFIVAVGLMASTAPAADAALGINSFDVTFAAQSGLPAWQAGSHPYAFTTRFFVDPATETSPDPVGVAEEGELKDIWVRQIAGLVGDPTATPQCPLDLFLNRGVVEGALEEEKYPLCPDSTAVGKIAVASGAARYYNGPVYNLQPPPGAPAELGFVIQSIPITVLVGVSPDPPYNIIGKVADANQQLPLEGSILTLWGNPANPSHDTERGLCAYGPRVKTFCPSNAPEVPFLTLPRACEGPLTTEYAADSWLIPGSFLPDGEPNISNGAWVTGSTNTHDNSEPPVAGGFTGCDRLGLEADITAQPTSKAAESPTGLDFSLNLNNEGLLNPTGVSNADVAKTEVTLPEGFTTNPSLAEGLNVCSEVDLARETVRSEPGAGCPAESKIGTVEVETPILDEPVDGSLFVATPYENKAGNSLLGLYLVIRNAKLGIIIKQPLKVIPDPQTGRLTTIADELPQLPFSHLRLHFREGTRSPLTTPDLCGEYPVTALITPSSGGRPVTTESLFSVISGPASGPCPLGGTPPFHPGLEAGAVNNAGGSYSPFYLHLTRRDGEQEITHFSIKLPPGVTGKLAGIPFCPDSSIAAAIARTGPHGGQEELEHPSCLAASEVGHTLAGVGVGPSLAYAPGKVYLAGPYHGSNISVVAITAAKVGPFDLGTVVVREGLKVNPETAEVSIDGAGSDPFPHIIKGIPVHLRDIRVYVDRPNFVRNPTSCERTSTASTVLGSGTDFVSESDDRPVTVTSRFQAADCAALGFKPRLQLSLSGPTKRTGLPRLKAVVTPGAADANIGRAVVTLPRSEFLEQGHIGTTCTRVQFNAGGGNGEQCPKKSVYGRAKAITPLLSEPLEGLVFLRSNGGERKLPDLVAALHSADINIDLVGFISSMHVKGSEASRIRNTFAAVPDAPVSKFTLEMFGGKKGLLVNSTNLCKGTHRALSRFVGQNGKAYETEPAVQTQCPKKTGAGKSKNRKKQVSARTMAAMFHRVVW